MGKLVEGNTAASKAQAAADYLRGLALAEPMAEAA
jgi:hypothetical protein